MHHPVPKSPASRATAAESGGAAPPTGPATPPPRRRLAGLRVALREFAIIVAGVLAALAAQAWWQSRSDRSVEAGYIAQLLADTRENRVRLDDAIAGDSASGEAARRLMQALDRPGPLPPADSLLEWFNSAGAASDFQPVTGTYRALLGTGDLRLIRTDSLRSLITAYAASLDSEAERLGQLRGLLLSVVPAGARAMPFMRRVFSGGPTAEDVAATDMRNDDVASILFTLQAANINRLSGLRGLREKTARLQTALEAETRGTDPPPAAPPQP